MTASNEEDCLSDRFTIAGQSIRVAGLKETQRTKVSEVIGRIHDDASFAATQCVCGEGQLSVQIAAIDRYGLPLRTVLCSGCGTLRFDPYLTADALAHFYRDDYQNMYGRAADLEALFQRQQANGARVHRAVGSHLANEGLTVEVGCGAGGTLFELKSLGHAVHGCDHSAKLIEYGQSRGLDNELAVGPDPLVEEKSARLVLLYHVFEHLMDPVEFLRMAKAWLTKSGLICVVVPDITRLSTRPAANGDLMPFLHIAHKYNFTRVGLAACGRLAGLHVTELPVNRVDPYRDLRMPEMWVVFHKEPMPRLGRELKEQQDYGANVMKLLVETEEAFAQGKTIAQRLNRMVARMARAKGIISEVFR